MNLNDVEKVNWDLSLLYSGMNDPFLESDLQSLPDQAQHFREQYHGQLNESYQLSPQLFAGALRDYEALQQKAVKPYLYAQLLFALDSQNEAHTRLVARVRELWQSVQEQTLFFELDILKLDEAVIAQLKKDPDVQSYAHYLKTLRAHAPYTLEESVEQALKRKDLSGKDAFVQLFDELTSGLMYRFLFPGEQEEREATGEELLALIYHSDRNVREQAFRIFLEKHADNALVLTSCLNNIVLDHGKEAELRGYPDLMTPTHLSSETDPDMVEKMLAVTEEHYPLAQDYFELKRQLLGYDVLKNTDLYAPVMESMRRFNFNEAMTLVLKAFEGFSPECAHIAQRLFDTGHIDVDPRPGKSGGAFCMGLYPQADPYILLNFNGTLRDVSTLAHELGHAIHYVLSGGQKYVHYHAPLPLAETASVFGEMLLTRLLLDTETDPRTRIALLSSKIEDIFATTFRQTVLTRFEQAAHQRRQKRLLSADELCNLWLEQNARYLGPVEMIPAYRWGWSYIGHFVHARFYCYSYVFGELLVLALYQAYRDNPQGEFVKGYLDVLRAGGSSRPETLLEPLGMNLHDPEFWAQGYTLVRQMVEELRALAEAYNTGS